MDSFSYSIDTFSKDLLDQYGDNLKSGQKRFKEIEYSFLKTLIADKKYDLLLYALENNIILLTCFRSLKIGATGDLKLCQHLHERGFKLSLYYIIESGNLETVKWVVENQLNKDYSYLNVRVAAQYGYFEIVKYLLEHGFEFRSTIYQTAAFWGHLHIIQWLYQARYFGLEFIIFASAFRNHRDIILWVEPIAPRQMDKACEGAAASGNLELLKWCLSRNYSLNARAMSRAIKGGHEEIISFLRENQCPLNRSCYFNAARYGNIGLLKEFFQVSKISSSLLFTYLIYSASIPDLDYFKAEGVLFDGLSYRIAVQRGDIEILNWLRDNGCSYYSGNQNMYPELCESAARHRNKEVIEWLFQNSLDNNPFINSKIIKSAFSNRKIEGLFEFVEWLISKGFSLTSKCYVYTGEYDMTIFNWLRSKEVEFPSKLWKVAIRFQNKAIVEYLYEDKCPFYIIGIEDAIAKCNNIEILNFLKEIAYDFDKNLVCYYAIRSSNISVLKWLKTEMDFKFEDPKWCLEAAKKCLAILKWLIQNGATYDRDILRHTTPEISAYIQTL